eukprot:1185142-Prorocentrum_minimum.AAC.5
MKKLDTVKNRGVSLYPTQRREDPEKSTAKNRSTSQKPYSAQRSEDPAKSFNKELSSLHMYAETNSDEYSWEKRVDDISYKVVGLRGSVKDMECVIEETPSSMHYCEETRKMKKKQREDAIKAVEIKQVEYEKNNAIVRKRRVTVSVGDNPQ